jgi:osmotically inducible protein OsmC
MQRQASAEWNGGLKNGQGTVSAPGGALQKTRYSFHTRFENGAGTNPEELIAAAHAGCFSMALSAQLESAGITAERIRTTCTIEFEKTDAGWTITGSHLDVKAKIPGSDPARLQEAAENAKSGCPVSRVLNTRISMTAALEE